VIACIVVVVSLVVGVGIICYRRGHRRGGYRTLYSPTDPSYEAEKELELEERQGNHNPDLDLEGFEEDYS
jgi:hypothetical protein